jgi:lipoprotein-anchoring transpeptidase ErfK/SrfK
VDGDQAILAGRRHLPTSKSYFLADTPFSNAFWRIAVLAATGILAVASPTEAAPSVFWPDYYEPYPRPWVAPQRVRKSIKKRVPMNEDVAKDPRKPQGPLIIAISIEKQVLKIYDANGTFAETPISTGMRGHSTPMGVFSVIQKRKYHHSNIYSGAPMPYMQRITWSGVAMHAGVLPGYPASHGCIRMPMNFAVKMWGWTRMGARVVITPGELTPESFSHPLLATQKISPAAAAPTNVDVAVTAKSDKAAMAGPIVTPSLSEASLQLRSTVGHDLARPAASEIGVSPTLREQTHTADASSVLSRSPATIIDAPVASNPAAKDDGDVKANDAQASGAKPKTPEADVKSVELVTSDKAGEIKPTEAGAAEAKPAEGNASAETRSAAAEIQGPAQPADEALKSESPTKAEDTKPEEKMMPAADASPAIPEVKKDQARPSDPEKAAAPKPEPGVTAAPKSSGQIAVFVSKKDGKLYVRQNFAPLFDVPVTIAPSDRPLGTHVFTAQTDKDDANLLHWSVVSMPVVTRDAARQDDDESVSRRRKTTGAIEVKPVPVPDSAAQALDRLAIPADAMARIAELLSTGSSIIVSDQGINAGETGEGTDFIIPLRSIN